MNVAVVLEDEEEEKKEKKLQQSSPPTQIYSSVGSVEKENEQERQMISEKVAEDRRTKKIAPSLHFLLAFFSFLRAVDVIITICLYWIYPL